MPIDRRPRLQLKRLLAFRLVHETLNQSGYAAQTKSVDRELLLHSRHFLRPYRSRGFRLIHPAAGR